ncbi:ECF transporter S component [Clostridia bacterium]|nr:ECF transporter S component [Clostridia bacterium]
MNSTSKTRKMIQITMLAVISFLLVYFVEFPLLAAAPYLKYDPSQVPTLIASFAFGPMAGLIAEVIKSFLFFISGKSTSGIVGVSAALVAGASFTMAAGLVYKFKKTRKGALLALIIGTLVMTVAMAIGNKYIFLPLWGIPQQGINGLVKTVILPFNLIKGLITSIITFMLYKRIHKILG